MDAVDQKFHRGTFEFPEKNSKPQQSHTMHMSDLNTPATDLRRESQAISQFDQPVTALFKRPSTEQAITK
jgi:hypothetical protein